MQAPTPPPKLFAPVRLKLWIAVACGLVLALGVLTLPAPTPTAVAPPQERPTPLLEEEVQRREQLRVFAELQDLGPRLARHSVTIPPPQPLAPLPSDIAMPAPRLDPAGHGLIVSADGEILTPASALRGRELLEVVLVSGQRVNAQLVAYDPETDLALLRADAIPRSDAAPWALQPPEAGVLAMAVAHTAGSVAVAPVFVTGPADRDGRIRTTTAELVPGTPVYTLQGEVFAVTSGGELPTAALVAPAVSRLRDRLASGIPRRGALGLIFQPLEGALQEVYPSPGALIADVMLNGPADAGGIESGDFITAIGDVQIATVDDARRVVASLPPQTPVAISVLRSGKPLTIEVAPISAFTMRARQAPRPPASGGLEARQLFDVPTREATGLLPRSRILEINGRATTTPAAALQQLRRPRGPVVLYLEDERGRFFRVLERPE